MFAEAAAKDARLPMGRMALPGPHTRASRSSIPNRQTSPVNDTMNHQLSLMPNYRRGRNGGALIQVKSTSSRRPNPLRLRQGVPRHVLDQKSCGQALGEAWPRANRSGTGRGGDVTGSRNSSKLCCFGLSVRRGRWRSTRPGGRRRARPRHWGLPATGA